MNTSTRIICTVVTLLFAAFGMFYQLGHYALWDDEADTALLARGILATGDTSAVVGHNIYAYRGGTALKGLCNRILPPLNPYIAAGMMRYCSDNPAALRAPFALFGFATVVLLLWWLYRDRADSTMWLLTCLAIVCNVSLFLFCRNCRYYGTAIFASTALAYLYVHWAGTPRQRLLWVLASLALIGSNYMMAIAVNACLLLDYVLFGRDSLRVTFRDFCWVLIPQAVIALPLVYVWNPLSTQITSSMVFTRGFALLKLFWWNVRDTNICEFYSAGLVLLALVLVWKNKDLWLKRGLVALGGYLAILTLISPQTLSETVVADVRYCVPLIPLGIFLGARTLAVIGANMPGQIAMLGAAVFFTNVLNGGALIRTGFHSGVVLFVRELLNRPEDPYTATAEWIKGHVKDGESIWVQPSYAIGPLMYHAPNAIYAWQLAGPPKGQFKGLAPINFRYESEPDYLIGFGPGLLPGMREEIHKRKEIKSRYIQVDVLTCYSRDLYRPELFWRNFGKDPGDDGQWGVVIYKRVPLAPELKDSLIIPKS